MNKNIIMREADSLGRKVGNAKNFGNYSDEDLLSLKDFINLSMSLSDLSYCRAYYKSKSIYSVSFSELYLLDEIVKRTRECPENTAIGDLYSNDHNIIETYNDLISKYAYLNGSQMPPLSVDIASKVSSRYNEAIGLMPCRGNIPTNLLTDNGTPLCSVLSQYEKRDELPNDTAFMLVSSAAGNTKEKLERVALCFDFAKFVIAVQRIDHRGIAVALAKLSRGVFADIFSLPALPDIPELSHLATEHEGNFIVALPKYAVAEFSQLAREYDLEAVYFAKAVPTQNILLYRQDHISMCLDTDLIIGLSSSLSSDNFKLLRNDMYIEYDRTNICLKTNEGVREYIQYGNTVSAQDTCVSPVVAKISDSLFVNSANTVIDAILPLVAKGIPRDEISLTVNYDFPKTSDNGDRLASVLGVYRSLTELCLPSKARIEYTDTDTVHLSSVAQGNNANIIIPQSVTLENNYLYFLSYNIGDDKLPDFESFRGMCDFLSKLISTGTAFSARAVSGKLSDAVSSMCGSYSIDINKKVEALMKDFQRGILVETICPITCGIHIGNISHFMW